MMDQFVIWELAGVRYLCIRESDGGAFLTRIKWLPLALGDFGYTAAK